MRLRLVFCFLAIALFVSISVVGANRQASDVSGGSSIKTRGVHERNSVTASSYRSPGKLHKAVVDTSDENALAHARAAGAVEIADYGSFKLFAMQVGVLEQVQLQSVADASERPGDLATAGLNVRDDLNVLLLRSGAIDTTGDEAGGSFVGMGSPATSFGLQSVAPHREDASSGSGQLRLVQFVGPVKRAWLDQLEASGLEVIAYVPNNGYLVRGDSKARARLMNRNEIAEVRGEGFVQWEGAFLDEHKIHPAVAEAIASPSGEITIAVQFALGKGERKSRDNNEVNRLESWRLVCWSIPMTW